MKEKQIFWVNSYCLVFFQKYRISWIIRDKFSIGFFSLEYSHIYIYPIYFYIMGFLLLVFEEKFIYSFSFYNLLKRRRLDLAEKFWGLKSKAIQIQIRDRCR